MSHRARHAAWLVLAALLLAAARPVEARLVRLRAEKLAVGASLAELAARPARPSAAALLADCLGGLRGILADVLWMRATRMEEEGRYYETVALLDGLLQLQPRFASVWAFQADVLIYDFSARERDADLRESAAWVKRGLEVLEEGIALNPTSSMLEFQTAHAYMFKLSPASPLPEWRRLRELVLPGEKESFPALRRAREHYLQAARKPDVSASRKLLCERFAIRCLERMGDWAGAEREWKALYDRYDRGIRLYRSTGKHFREFLRNVLAEELARGNLEASRGWYRKLRGYFPDETASYRQVVVERIRVCHRTWDEEFARKLYAALRRAEPGQTRSYEELVGAAAAGVRPRTGGDNIEEKESRP